jgi:glycosyltransferase involved in cell wall biosynthesis
VESDPLVPRRALLFSYSDIGSDPRVRRQVDWLTGDGWVVDTVGLGGHPAPAVRDHFAVHDPSRWVTTKTGILLTSFLITRRRRFRLQVSQRIPARALDRLRAGEYGLLVFNETEFTPLLSDRRDFTSAGARARIHLDLHEYHNPRMRRRTLGGRLTSRHYRWVRDQIAHPAITSRSVVNAPIGRLYAEEFAIPPLTTVRNAPPAVEQPPSDVDEDSIRLLFHGQAAWQRGLTDILDAMRELPERFTMTFMLMPNPALIPELQARIDAHPARERIRIVPPAPMREIAHRINEYDLEIIFYKPLGRNLEFALPNKFFEAVQGRLGLVVGESPAMAEIVRARGLGIVVPGFEAKDLAEAIAALNADDIRGFKHAADAAARDLNAENEGRAFLSALESVSESTR